MPSLLTSLYTVPRGRLLAVSHALLSYGVDTPPHLSTITLNTPSPDLHLSPHLKMAHSHLAQMHSAGGCFMVRSSPSDISPPSPHRPRVLMGLQFYPRGGSAHVVRALASALPQQGWDATVVASSVRNGQGGAS